MNVLASRPAPRLRPGAGAAGAEAPAAEAEAEASAGTHTDDTLGDVMPASWSGVAHQTDVLYVAVPSDMTAGTLQLWTPDLSGGRSSALEDEPPGGEHANGTCQGGVEYGQPGVVVVPRENEAASFRGDASHRVLRHGSALPGRPGWRVSLVLEQYRLPTGGGAHAPPAFAVSGQDDPAWAAENAALRPCRHLLRPLPPRDDA